MKVYNSNPCYGFIFIYMFAFGKKPGLGGVEVAIAGGLDEDADSLGDLRLSPRDESMSAGFPRLFSSAAAVTTRCGNDFSKKVCNLR